MYDVLVAIRELLKADSSLQSKLNKNPSVPNDIEIYTRHISSVAEVDRSYPCVTICQLTGGNDSIRLGKDEVYQVDVWDNSTTGNAYKSVKQIADLVDLALNRKSTSYGNVCLSIIDNIDSGDGYNDKTFTYQAYNKYRIKAQSSL